MELDDELDRKKKQQERRVLRIGVLAALVLVVILAVAFIVQRYMPTSEYMSGYDYFEAEKDSGYVMAILNGEQSYEAGVKIDGRIYFLQSYIADHINIRFYYDKESDAVLYTDDEKIYTFTPDSNQYKDSQGQTYTADAPVARLVNEAVYLDFEFVAARTNCTYVYADTPERVVIETGHDEIMCVTGKKADAVRYRAGIKSKILEKVESGEQMYFLRSIDDEWSEVKTASGYTGYIKTKNISEPFTVVPEDTYTEQYSCIQKDYKINMTWFQVTNAAANANIDSFLTAAYGLNTISPTWYSITDASGGLSSLASGDFVRNMHGKGIEVWPLVNDFDKEVDYKALYSSKAARTNMIDRLMADAQTYGYDGINIDFENIKSEYAQDFLQFVREISVACQKNGVVLSIDNYKPESFNNFYNLKEQAVFADYVIFMGYDEHYAGSEAGSVASLPFVEEGIADIVSMVPGSQVVMAMPFYTRIWTESGASTTSKAVGMQAAINDLNANGAIAIWDETVGQYFGSYEKNGATIRIWCEEDKSIEEKLKLVDKYQLAGISSWKLGLEKASVWQVIHQYIGQ